MVQLSLDTRAVLRSYIEGQVTNSELEEWLTQAEHDSDVMDDERAVLARLRLAVLEAGEGLRPNEDILGAVAAAFAPCQPDGPVLAFRTGSATSGLQQPKGTATPSRITYAGIGISA